MLNVQFKGGTLINLTLTLNHDWVKHKTSRKETEQYWYTANLSFIDRKIQKNFR